MAGYSEESRKVGQGVGVLTERVVERVCNGYDNNLRVEPAPVTR